MKRFGIFFGAAALTACLTSALAEDAAQPQPQRRDVSKTIAIEAPVKDLLIAATKAPDKNAQTSTAFENPKVAPGKVRWHEGFAAACAASQQSGKPVLLFQLMGNLDDRFC